MTIWRRGTAVAERLSLLSSDALEAATNAFGAAAGIEQTPSGKHYLTNRISASAGNMSS